MHEYPPRRVRLSSRPQRGDELDELARTASGLAGAEVASVLAWGVSLGALVPSPGAGSTLTRWELLATVAAQDLTAARVLEPHLDALSILAEAGERADPLSTWGVWAAEGPGPRLEARRDDAGGWVLEGRKPWCSLARSLTHALVTAWVGPHERRLFAIDLMDGGIRHEDDTWVPSGLARVVTNAVSMSGVPGRPIGATEWYLSRDGFWWGGIGVAAVWYGGAVGLARRLAMQVAARPADQIALMQLGRVDAALAAARASLADAADQVDSRGVTGPAARLLATRVRHVVATSVEDVAQHVAHALGPGPLSQEPDHVARVADLALYLRQHHAERDAAELGRLLADGGNGTHPW